MITNRPGTFAPHSAVRGRPVSNGNIGPDGSSNFAAKPLQMIEKCIGDYPVATLVAGVAIGVALGWLVKRGK